MGGGVDTARALYGTEDRETVRFARKIGGVAYHVKYEPIPLHPHNSVLQVWLEMGALGALILMVLLLSVVRAIHHFVEGNVNRATALGLFTTVLTIASISFGAWQSWWLASIFLVAAFTVSTLAPLGRLLPRKLTAQEDPTRPATATGRRRTAPSNFRP